MPRTSEYTAGWIDTTIHDFLTDIEQVSPSMAYALITCLDSTFDVPPLLQASPALRALREKCRVIGKGILVTTRQLLVAKRESRILFGFDEVWFFPRPEVSPKPKGFVLTGPERVPIELVERYSNWLSGNGCSLGLGDGTGMNFCARLRGVARYLVRSFGETESARHAENRHGA
jgi:hypothetical protein